MITTNPPIIPPSLIESWGRETPEWFIIKDKPIYLDSKGNYCRRNNPIWQIFNPAIEDIEEGFLYSALSPNEAVKFCKQRGASFKFI